MKKNKKIWITTILSIVLVICAAFILYNANRNDIHTLSAEEFASLREYTAEDFAYLEEKYPWYKVSSFGTYHFSVSELIEQSNVIIYAEYAGEGEIVGMGNGKIRLGTDTVIDDTAYYVETFYTIKEVYKGQEFTDIQDSSAKSKLQRDNTITVLEYIGYGKEADRKYLEDKSGDYLLMLKADNTDQLYTQPLYSFNKVDEKGNIDWQSRVLTEATKFEGVSNLDAIEKLTD